MDVDVLLKGGTIIDGSGGQPYTGDVAVLGDRIVAVGDIGKVNAGQTIECEGLVVCPGFIDLHNHSDHETRPVGAEDDKGDDDEKAVKEPKELSITKPETRDARCYVTQGCTTLVTGNCGGGQRKVGEYYDRIAESGVGINVAHLIPHGAIRDEVMGKVRRAPTDEVLQKMQQLADAGMKEGAWGMSTGLQYVPGAYANTDEIVAIASIVAGHGGIYASHMRDESDELLEAVEEVLEIARRAKLPCHISHFKSSQRQNWGKVRVAARLVEQAQQEGLRITADQYPYNASSTSIMAMLLPEEEREGGEEATSKRLEDPEVVARVRPMVAAALAARGQIMIASCRTKPEWIGKMIVEVAKEEGREPVEVGLDLLRDGRAQGVNFGMDEADVRYVMTLPWVATASDGSSKIDDGTRPHPRSYGTFARKIGRYSIQEKVLPLPLAVRSASGLPAEILGMRDRGYIRESLAADVVVLDPSSFEDRATYEKPFENAVGVRWVLINGKVVIADGVPQDVLAGRPLRRTGS